MTVPDGVYHAFTFLMFFIMTRDLYGAWKDNKEYKRDQESRRTRIALVNILWNLKVLKEDHWR